MPLETTQYGDRWFFRFVEGLIPVDHVAEIRYLAEGEVALMPDGPIPTPAREGQILVSCKNGARGVRTPIKTERPAFCSWCGTPTGQETPTKAEWQDADHQSVTIPLSQLKTFQDIQARLIALEADQDDGK